MKNNNQLGEVSSENIPQEEPIENTLQLNNNINNTIQEEQDTEVLKEDSPTFKDAKDISLTNNKYSHCKTCGNESLLGLIDGECFTCALKRLRKIETKLVELNIMKSEHKFCVCEGHSEIYTNKLHPDWCGKIVINGVELYPIFPLCESCLNSITAYLVNYLEERGIVRKGSGHIKNIFGEPYGTPYNPVDKQNFVNRLTAFIRSINIYTLDTTSHTNSIYNFIRNIRKILYKRDIKEIQEWKKEKEVKLPNNQVELLKLAEKYSPCLQTISKEKQEKIEVNFLENNAIPNEIKNIIEKRLITWLQINLLNELHTLSLQLQQAKNQDLEEQKLSWPLLKNFVEKLHPEKLNDLEKLHLSIQQALGTPYVKCVEELLTELLEKYTIFSLVCKLMNDE